MGKRQAACRPVAVTSCNPSLRSVNSCGMSSSGNPRNAGAAAADRDKLAQMLAAARADAVDGPIYQIVDGFSDIRYIKIDAFRESRGIFGGASSRSSPTRAEKRKRDETIADAYLERSAHARDSFVASRSMTTVLAMGT